MERDALLAHGTSFLLQDRLMNCSDYSTAWVCKRCGLLSSLGYDLSDEADVGASHHHPSPLQAEPTYSSSVKIRGPQGEYCRQCEPLLAESARSSLPSQDSLSLESLSGQLTNHMDVIAIPYVSSFFSPFLRHPSRTPY
jgi:DNA-directed RNA polymerase I subunit RPA2